MKKQRPLALFILKIMESAAASAVAGADHPVKKAAIEQHLADARAAIKNGRLDLAMAATWNCCLGLTESQIGGHYDSGTKRGQDIELIRKRKEKQSGPLARMEVTEDSQLKTKLAVVAAWGKIAPSVKRSPTKGALLLSEDFPCYIDNKKRKILGKGTIKKWLQENEVCRKKSPALSR